MRNVSSFTVQTLEKCRMLGYARKKEESGYENVCRRMHVFIFSGMR